VKRWFSLVLLLAAMLGLLGQEAVFARAMPIEQTEQMVAAPEMSAECAEMMGLTKPQPQPDQQPCKGMTPDCIAKMGCAVPLALIPPALIAPPIQLHATTPPQTPVVRLVGRNTGPEPDPPTRLG
jgi:hypothetical protein